LIDERFVLAMNLPGPKISVIHQTVTRSADGMGGFTTSWANTETFKALMVARGQLTREMVKYEKDTVVADHTLYCMGKKPDNTARTITTDDRIKYGTRLFDIEFVDNVANLGDYIQLSLTERDGD